MTPSEYMTAARRTDVTAESPREQFEHAAIGVGTEAGELLDIMKKHRYYGKEPDLVHKLEEWGDLLWYVAVGLGADGLSFEQAFEANIAKLKKRYGDKFSNTGASARDLVAEHEAVKAKLFQGKFVDHWDVQTAWADKSLPRLIGLSGKKRAGKDSAAKMLAGLGGYKRFAFADRLKEAAKVIFGLTEDQVNGKDREIEDAFWRKTPRQILQLFGTECLREGYDDDVWVSAMERELRETKDYVVITDVRFPNEAEMIHKLGGEVWRVERLDSANRPMGYETGSHVSETALDDYRFDERLVAKDLSDLETEVRRCLFSERTFPPRARSSDK